MIKKRPRHIGIIPDGNRRWAKEHGMNKQDGYKWGAAPGASAAAAGKGSGHRRNHLLWFYRRQLQAAGSAVCGIPAGMCRCRGAFEAGGRRSSGDWKYGFPMLPRGTSSLYNENPGKRRRDPAEFSCELWMGVGSVPYAPGRKALFLRYLQGGYGHPLGRHAKALRLSAPAECLRGFLRL